MYKEGAPLRCSPFHQTELTQGKAKLTGWPYYRCPVSGCVFFCGEDRVDDWPRRMAGAVHAGYKEPPTDHLKTRVPFTCFCTHEPYPQLKLGKSESVKKPHRFFLTCKFNKCKFFQWLDTPLLSRNVPAWQRPLNQV